MNECRWGRSAARVSEINEDPEFSAAAITAEEFEQVWQRATREG
ncbi:MAG TPA: hypothetical protein VGS19_03595 [Streptosporangiaceae bacterium]|nr:hypothetical protein [Streptosporangiaceae bacterium]